MYYKVLVRLQVQLGLSRSVFALFHDQGCLLVTRFQYIHIILQKPNLNKRKLYWVKIARTGKETKWIDVVSLWNIV